MKTSLVTHTSVDSFDNDFPILYYNKSYLKSQNHSSLICYENDRLFLPVSLEGKAAISIPRSPFGSFFVKDSCSADEFLLFLDEIKKDLGQRGITEIEITHPPAIYEDYVDQNWLEKVGFQHEYADISQHIPLDLEWHESIHEMQRRKLISLESEGFIFQKMSPEDLETAHQFVEVCRLTQELSINITYDRLKQLSDSTGAYDIFGVFRDGKISSLCIAVRVTNKIAYYYLPATSPMFRSQSPMVSLIAGMVAYYRSQGYEHFDLGISSVQGKPQESLRIFKERMGAVQSEKIKLSLQI